MNFLKCWNRLFAYNSSRYRLTQEIENFATLVPRDALILDAGAGDAPYKTFFQHAQYESADFEKVDKRYERSTYVCDLRKIPVDDCRFDYIIFTQVMEHLQDPLLVLTELYRVLKPGGKMIYTGPFFYEEHEQPYDFYRYTQYGLQYLFVSAGFIINRIEWLEGYFGTVGYKLHCMSCYLPFKPKDISVNLSGYAIAPLMLILKLLFVASSTLFHKLEKRVKYVACGYPKNYVAIVTKSPTTQTTSKPLGPSFRKNTKKRHFLSIFYGTTKYFINKINALQAAFT